MCKHIVLQSDFNFLNIKQPTGGVLLIIRISIISDKLLTVNLWTFPLYYDFNCVVIAYKISIFNYKRNIS